MDLNASDGIQIGVGVVLTLTLGAVLWYACEARKQAKASAQMVEEIREQRMAQDEPWLILDIADQKLADYHEWDEQNQTLKHKHTGEEVKPWPLPDCTVRVHNAGRAAAVSVEACYLEAENHYLHSPRGFILQGETCSLELSGFPAFYGRRPLWREEPLHRLSLSRPGCVLVRYYDVHGRAWASYLGLDWYPEMVPYVVPQEQGRLRLCDHDKAWPPPITTSDKTK